jgi:four helix bundle protein
MEVQNLKLDHFTAASPPPSVNPAKTCADLVVWQKAHALVLMVYHLTESCPKTKTYGLTSQLRRAAVSVPANIAEGFQKRGNADKLRFFNIAQGSLGECDHYLILAQDLHYAATTNLRHELAQVGRLRHAYLSAFARNAD